MAGSFTNWTEAQVLNHLFGGVPWSPLSTLYFGYMVGQPQETGAGAEPNSGGYVRKGVSNNVTNFPVTANQTKTHATAINWDKAATNHGNVVSIGVWDSPSGGNLIAFWLLPAPILISENMAMELPASSLSLSFVAGGLSNYVKNGMLNHIFGGVPFNVIPIMYAGYATTIPTDAVPGSEPSGNGYARSQFNNDTNMFPVTSQGQKTNGLKLEFPEATGSQGTASHVQFFDSPSGGNYLGRYALPVAMSVVLNSIPEIGLGTILITLD